MNGIRSRVTIGIDHQFFRLSIHSSVNRKKFLENSVFSKRFSSKSRVISCKSEWSKFHSDPNMLRLPKDGEFTWIPIDLSQKYNFCFLCDTQLHNNLPNFLSFSGFQAWWPLGEQHHSLACTTQTGNWCCNSFHSTTPSSQSRQKNKHPNSWSLGIRKKLFKVKFIVHTVQNLQFVRRLSNRGRYK